MHKMTHKKYKFSLLLLAVAFILMLLPSGITSAEPCPDGSDGGTIRQIENGSCANHQTGGPEPDDEEASGGGGGTGSIEPDCKPAAGEELNRTNCKIIDWIVRITNALSAMVGLVIIIMIAVGGVQYSMARDDPQQVSAAKTRIRNAILALVFFLFGFALLQWLIPGGVFQ